MTLVWLGGRILDGARATISVADRGFLLGDGLFETMRARGRKVFRLAAHMERLAGGAKRLAIPVPEGIEDAVAGLLEAGGWVEAALRLTLTRGPGDGGLETPSPAKPTLAIALRQAPVFSRAWYESGLSIQLAGHRLSTRSATAGIKTIGYLPNILSLSEARSAGADDALVLNERDEVAEASASNLFWVAPEGELRTPSLACGILPGITRAVVIDLARFWKLPLAEGAWGPEEVARAREVFTTSSLRGIAPVTSFDGRPVGGGLVGELTLRIMDEYEALVRRETS